MLKVASLLSTQREPVQIWHIAPDYAVLAQMVERPPEEGKVFGSLPKGGTTILRKVMLNGFGECLLNISG